MLVTEQQALPPLCSSQAALAVSCLLLLLCFPWFLTPAWLHAEGKPCWDQLCEPSWCSAGSWGWRRKEGGRGRAGRWMNQLGCAGEGGQVCLWTRLTHCFSSMYSTSIAAVGTAVGVLPGPPPAAALPTQSLFAAWQEGLGARGRGLLASGGAGIFSAQEATSIRQWLRRPPGSGET